MNLKLTILLAAVILGLPRFLFGADQEPDYPEKKGKIIVATYVNPEPPRIDGRLDDPIWQKIRPVTDFVQTDPDEMVTPSESTEVRIAYDRRALYIAVRCFDSEPAKIITRVNRRDNLRNSDAVRIYIDSQHDHQTAFVFGTNPSGVYYDSFISSDGEGGRGGRGGRWGDANWNAVWDVATQIDSLGWTAEFMIPFSMLRYPSEEEQTWGLNIQRQIERKREDIWWVPRPRGASGFVSRFGHLAGLKGLISPRRLEFLPYVTARRNWFQTNGTIDAFDKGAGLDLKYGLSSGITLDATLNPDFGQVEADPEVLNLTVFETFYPEKRPFFIEGAHLFSTPFRLFHSRRIGKRPGTYSVRPGDQILDKPDFTTIYSAAKITGKTSGGLSFALLDAVTAPEYARVKTTVSDSLTGAEVEKTERRLIEPLTNYFVGRLMQDLWKGNSRIGLTLTAMNREPAPEGQSQNNKALGAYSGGIDWFLWTPDNQFLFSGQTAFSARQLRQTRDFGYAIQARISREGGKIVHGGLGITAISPDFQINDLGYNRRTDFIALNANFRFFTTDYHWITRRIFVVLSGQYSRNYSGLELRKGFGIRNFFIFRNYWSFRFEYNRSLDVYDDLETRGGPPMLNPGSHRIQLSFDTDRRKMVDLRFDYNHSWNRFGGWSNNYRLTVNVKLNEQVNVSFNPRFTDRFDVAQWVTNIDEDGDSHYEHYVFGELRNRILDLTLRANLAFNRNLSLQFYMQPFLTSGKYSNYKELARPKSFAFLPYPLDRNFNFRIASYKSNMVIRWEYRPGSTLYVVWTRTLRDYAPEGEFRLQDDLAGLFREAGNNVFMVKLNYWLNI